VTVAFGHARHRPKETAQLLEEGNQAGEFKRDANGTPDELDQATGECRLLVSLQARLARFDAHLYALTSDTYLLSQDGGLTLCLPDLRAARLLITQWEEVQ
jgi:hypothetical protein